jgi:acetoin utilization deacetylase AcuC-like enzyme
MKEDLAVIYDERCLLHKASFVHPESPGRITAVLNYLKEKSFWEQLKIYTPEEASEEIILLVHTKAYYNAVKYAIDSGKEMLDPDTYAVKDSWLAAHLAVGSVKMGVDLVMSKSHKYIFSLMRPPGHHAEQSTAMGFCLFNNVAIAAQYAIDKYKLSRIAVIDWDVHHGNGTQEIFYDSSRVYFISLHQFPLYPGTGKANERGIGEGEGYTLNFPLPRGTNGDTYLKIFKERIITELKEYDPELIFISAGFDAHKDDPLAGLNLDEKDFRGMTEILKNFSSKNENKVIPIISVLEGGYNLTALPRSVYEHLDAFIQP